MAERPSVVLGSASPARAALLRAAGIDPWIVPSTVDESDLVRAAGARAADPHWLTAHLAAAKAADVARRLAGPARPADLPSGRRTLVIGADSLLWFGGRVLGKSDSADEVRERWAALRGGTGELVTGHVVLDVGSGATAEATVSTTIRFGRPEPDELEAYIASGEPLAVAGSCTIDGLGGPFIDGIDGDHGNVIGLSLPTLRRALAELGVKWTDLWRPGTVNGGPAH